MFVDHFILNLFYDTNRSVFKIIINIIIIIKKYLNIMI